MSHKILNTPQEAASFLQSITKSIAEMPFKYVDVWDLFIRMLMVCGNNDEGGITIGKRNWYLVVHNSSCWGSDGKETEEDRIGVKSPNRLGRIRISSCPGSTGPHETGTSCLISTTPTGLQTSSLIFDFVTLLPHPTTQCSQIWNIPIFCSLVGHIIPSAPGPTPGVTSTQFIRTINPGSLDSWPLSAVPKVLVRAKPQPFSADQGNSYFQL